MRMRYSPAREDQQTDQILGLHAALEALQLNHRRARMSHAPACPHCRGSLHRVRRRMFDHLISLVLPVRRYQCLSMGCEWEGNLRDRRPLHLRDGHTPFDAQRQPFL